MLRWGESVKDSRDMFFLEVSGYASAVKWVYKG